MINLISWEKWKDSLSEEDVMKAFDKFGSTFQVPEIVYFGFNKVREKSISPTSGYLRIFDRNDFFDGRGISVVGYSYLEGLLSKDKNVLKMIEFYELPHSLGDWCVYDVDLKKGEGNYEHVRAGKRFDLGKIEVISLVNDFSLIKGLDGLNFSHIKNGGSQPKKLTEFWTNLKKEGFNVPQEYYSSDEIDFAYKSSLNSPEDDLPF